ncbi:Patched-related protein 9 [Toxocara canis]|uniref:Patched-related protein 9 n=1 Tax=Toxocara canis TaxID=6265 RepID=A0A0B2VQC0_TOXCA|nr:Patched-related protein 9 [Toxocara canis]
MHDGLGKIFDTTNRQIAFLVSTYPKYFLLASFLLAAIFAAPLFNCTFEGDIRKSFSPPNSRASREEAVHMRFFNITSVLQRTFILFYAKDGGSMLRKENMNEMLRIDSILRKRIEAVDASGQRGCEPLCTLNAPFFLFWKELRKAQENVFGNESDSECFFDFPTSTLYGHEFFVGMNMFGVQTADRMFANHSRITHVATVVLWYFSQVHFPETKRLLEETIIALFEMSKAKNASALIQFDIFGDQIANKEMLRGALQATKLMIIGFFLLLAFVFAVVWQKVHWHRSLPRIALAAVLSPFLAAVIAFGVLAMFRFPFYSIMCVTPFLILGIGVDDAFIMLQSWTHYRMVSCKKERLSKVFVEIGPSISITSITNMIAFGIGYLTPTPQMSMFCLCTSLACLIDYILTFTLFAPILFMSDDTNEGYNSAEKASQQQSGKKWTATYSRFVCSSYGKLSALLILVSLYTLSTIGVISMKSTFEPAKAFPSDSPLANSLEGLRAVSNEFSPLQIIVNNPPNISNKTEYDNFYEMVSSLESVRFSYGRERTVLFLKAYEKFDRTTFEFLNAFGFTGETQYSPSYDNLPFFLNQIHNPPNIKVTRDQKGVTKLVAFQMTIIAHNMSEWSSRAIYLDECRSVLLRYPQFNATIFDWDSAVLDLILTVKTDLIGSIAVTVLCMAIVCLFFVSSRTGVLVVTFTISSTCFTLVGALSWWGADMDPVTMVDVLIATGFSVDFTAHIAYKFYKGQGTSAQRIEQSFNEMCEPMMQAGTSTALCMLPLIFVPTYAILAFAKTIFLVVSLGLLHGIFLLPILLVTVSSKADVDELPQKGNLDDLERRKEPLLL